MSSQNESKIVQRLASRWNNLALKMFGTFQDLPSGDTFDGTATESLTEACVWIVGTQTCAYNCFDVDSEARSTIQQVVKSGKRSRQPKKHSSNGTWEKQATQGHGKILEARPL